MTEIRLEVLGEPRPWTVWVRKGKASTGYERMLEYQDRIRIAARQAMGYATPWTGPVYLDMWFYRGLSDTRAPMSEPAKSKWAEKHILTRPDVTNYRKAAEDACQGILIADDAAVVGGWTEKGYVEGPGRTVIMMRPA